MEGRIGDALEAEMEAYRFADAIGRGGLSADFLYSMSCKGLVLRACQSLSLNLTPLQKSQLLQLVRETEANEDTPKTVAQRTLRWRRATFGLKGDWNEWRQAVEDAWQSHSWAPLRATGRSILASRRTVYEQQYLDPFCQQFAHAQEPDPTRAEPQHPADGSQPSRSDSCVSFRPIGRVESLASGICDRQHPSVNAEKWLCLPGLPLRPLFHDPEVQ
jgi:hypothetical protein